MTERAVRVRFAPAPTGIMHLGNVRTALMNYLFALKYNGTSIIRIEDTDAQRNFDPSGEIILKDLSWLTIQYQEGPHLGGHYGPYIQSQRTALYDTYLKKLQEKKVIYRCFCTQEQLETKRARQQALKQPPRYDRTCFNLLTDTINKSLTEGKPFIWRVAIDQTQEITIEDLAHGPINFALKNFSDFPITRQDGSFTFLFANFIDDMTMEISHVFRGEDHLTNTACQAFLYQVFGKAIPIFWHMPIICNKDGKKLSKRDFGFSLHTLREAGFLPEAITNYLAIIGTSCEQEIMSLEEMAHNLNLMKPSATGAIKYDSEKMRWVNHKWITRYNPLQLAQACRPFLSSVYHDAVDAMSDEHLALLLTPVQSDLITLQDSIAALHFYFTEPALSESGMELCISSEHRLKLIHLLTPYMHHAIKDALPAIIKEVKEQKIPTKELYTWLRFSLTGSPHGIAIAPLLEVLSEKTVQKRVQVGLEMLSRIS